MTHVFKFGGTCTSTIKKLERITELISEVDHPLVVTVSAASGVTKSLSKLLENKLDDELIKMSLQHLRERHYGLLLDQFTMPDINEENFKRLERLLYGIYYTEEITERSFDLIMTFGERLIAPILQLYLEHVGIVSKIVYPEEIIRTNGQYSNAIVDLEKTEILINQILKPISEEYRVVIVPGYYGISEDETVTTLGRSGTDYTGTVLAHGLDAEGVTIWKDVKGFMSADPKLVPNAHTIPTLTYQEAAELAYFGAKLLHPMSASPARLKHIPIYIRHLNNVDAITCINSGSSMSERVIKSVSHLNNLALVEVYVTIGGNSSDVLAKLTQKIADGGGTPISLATSQTCFAFLMKEIHVISAVDQIKSLGQELIEKVELVENISLIGVVGEGLVLTPDIVHRVFGAVSSRGINIQLVSAGASKVAYHFTVSEKDLTPALNAIHDDFF